MCSSEANRLLILDLEKIAYNVRILSKERHRHRHRRFRLTRNHDSKTSEQHNYNSTRNPTSAVHRAVSEILAAIGLGTVPFHDQ